MRLLSSLTRMEAWLAMCATNVGGFYDVASKVLAAGYTVINPQGR